MSQPHQRKGSRRRALTPEARRQLPLALPVEPSYAPEDFLETEQTAPALRLVRRWPEWPGPALLIHGPAGAGKSHLAAVHAHHAAAQRLDPDQLDPAQPAALAAHLPYQAALILDPLEPWLAHPLRERALFHLLNALLEQDATLLICARAAPGGLAAGLPDLTSRLHALPAVALPAPGADLRLAIAVKIFSDYQLVPDPVALETLLSLGPRDVCGLQTAIHRLNDLALTRQARTVSLSDVRDVLQTPPDHAA